MTPPLCPTCGRRGSEREVCVPGTPPYDDEMHGEVCPSPFHDAGDWGPALLEAAKDVLAVLELGVDPGPHHMDTLDGRAAWIDRMKPARERLRAAVEGKEK